MNPIEQLSKILNISFKQVSKTVELLKEGGTVPFISRYRKEQTGGLDEVQILDIKPPVQDSHRDSFKFLSTKILPKLFNIFSKLISILCKKMNYD